MTYVHSQFTVITVATKDISPFCTTSQLTRGADEHDVTGYGKPAHVFGDGGLKKGEFTCGGTYDNTASTGPHNAIRPLVGTIATITRKPEGTGAGKPLETFSAFVAEYVETSPVADYVTWSAKFTVSDTIADTTQ